MLENIRAAFNTLVHLCAEFGARVDILTNDDLLASPLSAMLLRIEDGIATEDEIARVRTVFAAAHTAGLTADFLAPVMATIQRAELRALGDDAISLREAAQILKVSLPAVNQMCDDGRITAYPDPDAPNPRRQSRYVSRAQLHEQGKFKN